MRRINGSFGEESSPSRRQQTGVVGGDTSLIEMNDWRWIEYPSVDLAETFVLSVAAGQSVRVIDNR